MNPQDKQKAFTIIATSLAKNQDWMSERDYQTGVLLSHPFDKSHKEMMEFVGFGSDSIYPFLFHACHPKSDRPKELIFWLVQVQGDPRQHQVWAEVRGEFTSYLTTGMTDYSGSGGSAYKEMKLAFQFLADLYNIEIVEKEVAWELGLKAERECSKALMETEELEEELAY
jgi:hypothetical protein